MASIRYSWWAGAGLLCRWSAQDARGAGFNTFVIEDACRAIDMNGSLENARKTMLGMGIERVQSADLLG